MDTCDYYITRYPGTTAKVLPKIPDIGPLIVNLLRDATFQQISMGSKLFIPKKYESCRLSGGWYGIFFETATNKGQSLGSYRPTEPSRLRTL